MKKKMPAAIGWLLAALLFNVTLGWAQTSPSTTSKPTTAVAAVTPAPAPAPVGGLPNVPDAYAVRPGDMLSISVWKEPDLERQVMVRPDGGISFPLVGEVDARGKSVGDLNRIIAERLKRFISDPVVTVSLQEIKGNKVYVIGQVNKPGEFIVNPRVNVLQALSMAGGMTPFADLGDIKVLRRAGDKQQALAFSYTDVIRGKRLEQNIDLMSGDVVVVP